MEWTRTLRQAARGLRRQPILSATIVLTLAIGIGANSLVFSLHRALIADAIPFAEPHELLTLTETVTRDAIEPRAFSFPDFLDLRTQATRLASLAAFSSEALSVTAADRAVERLIGERISDRYFATLGIEPAFGRAIEGERESDTVVIGTRLAERLFGEAERAVGGLVRVDERPYTVAGVMPAAFRGASDQAEVWFPMRAGDPSALERRHSRFLSAVGRMAPGSSLTAVRAELSTVFDALAAAHPQTNEGYGATATPLAENMLGDLRGMSTALLACVLFLMLAVCLNLSNLLISRAAARGHEDAVRIALGAGRARLAAHAAVEIAMLTFLGAFGALLVAQWGVELLRLLLPVTLPTFIQFDVDSATLAFTFALALFTAILLTMLLSLGRSGRRALTALRGLRSTTMDRKGKRVRALLVGGQVALALALTIGAGLLSRTVLAMSAIDPGFDAENLSTFRFDQPEAREASAGAQLARGLVEAIDALPGVESVALASSLPLDGANSATVIAKEGQAPDPDAVYAGATRVYRHRVDDRYFSTLAIPLLEGRVFAPGEIGGEAEVAVISRRLADKLWPGESALGKRLRPGRPTGDAEGDADGWLTVVGVVGEVRHRTLVDQPGTPRDPDLYRPLAARSYDNLAVAIRAAPSGGPPLASIQTLVARLDPQVPTYAAAEMAGLIAQRAGRARFSATMMSAFAAIALLLASIGIYGTIAYAVAQRTREIGVRMAVGATRGSVMRLLVGEGMRLVSVGGAIGIMAALVVVRLVRAQLVAISPLDPLSFLVAIALVAVAATVACALPARHASRLDPVRALGSDP